MNMIRDEHRRKLNISFIIFVDRKFDIPRDSDQCEEISQ